MHVALWHDKAPKLYQHQHSCMRNIDLQARGAPQQPSRSDALREEGVRHFGVHRTQRIVQQHNICAAVGGAREREACLLATGQRDSALADLGVSAGGKVRKIMAESARRNDGVEPAD